MKTALIVGASTGAGPGIAKVLNANGHHVMLASKRKERLEKTLSTLNERSDSLVTDIMDSENLELMVRVALERLGGIDVLVNNAGVMELSEFKDLDPVQLNRMIDINLRSLILTTHATLPSMLQRGEGHVVNISGVSALKSFPSAAVYSATKAGVRSFSEGLRQELTGENIRVTTIYPGGIKSDPPRSISDQVLISGGNKKRGFALLEPEAVGDAVLYAIEQPQSVCVGEIVLRPSNQRV